jgi:hypothetical protein
MADVQSYQRNLFLNGRAVRGRHDDLVAHLAGYDTVLGELVF